ncbi:hypothetical protein NWF24_26465 [Variovorax paradoxus]|uniref:hypothetical protein n=1 Tax=Variovorax paradoxus TaxID=34073 RepID=UPI0021AC23DE|nr:hypothetical protein [Variovorax paradoxus]UVH56359.1 hypothetical protein NWF24_26465 [Variovorax paradoxus]
MEIHPLIKPGAFPLMFEAAVARSRDDLFLACSNGEDRFGGFARMCRYRGGANPPWNYFDLPTTISRATLFSPKQEAGASAASTVTAFVFLTEEGDVMHLPIGREPIAERIEGSGLWSDDSEGWGTMNAIAQIDSRLHACGGGGQVYRRSDAGTWEQIGTGLLRGKTETGGLTLNAIAGPHEQEVYVGGWRANVNDGVLFCGNNRGWKPMTSSFASISSIHVERDDSIWACGRRGTVLHGNRIDGFKDVSELDDTRSYVDITSYDGQIFLATERGLYVHDNGTTRRVQTGLDPDHADGHVLQVVDGVLWSIGYADIVRFDGSRWERIAFPGNPSIR